MQIENMKLSKPEKNILSIWFVSSLLVVDRRLETHLHFSSVLWLQGYLESIEKRMNWARKISKYCLFTSVSTNVNLLVVWMAAHIMFVVSKPASYDIKLGLGFAFLKTTLWGFYVRDKCGNLGHWLACSFNSYKSWNCIQFTIKTDWKIKKIKTE